jgi:hypothetical protein
MELFLPYRDKKVVQLITVRFRTPLQLKCCFEDATAIAYLFEPERTREKYFKYFKT